MTSDKMYEALSEQINKELYSGYLYLAMAAWFEGRGLAGFGNWMQVQAQEELSHAMKFYRYVYERGGRVQLGVIDAPAATWDSVRAVFAQVLEHERFVSARIDELVTRARADKDYASEQMLQWFVAEQVEEEASAHALLDRVTLIGEQGPGLYQLDRELATRVFVNEAA